MNRGAFKPPRRIAAPVLSREELRTKAHAVLLKHWGYKNFRAGQLEALEASVLRKQDTFVLMATGQGKSLCYQLPALVTGLPVVVISPLISLMEDQVLALNQRGIAACHLSSTQEDMNVFEQARRGEFSLVYMSPERLQMAQGLIEDLIKNKGVCCFAIDESHCISEWGHDFRSAYRDLRQLRNWFPKVPICAVTATATHSVATDIIQQLALRDPLWIQATFNRPNLFYSCRPSRAYEQDLTLDLFMASGPGAASGSGSGSSGSSSSSSSSSTSGSSVGSRWRAPSAIVYCTSKKETEKLAQHLSSLGIAASAYHAGLSAEARRTTHQEFLRDRIQVVVATVAFGMGIDKPDIRLVVHCGIPKSIESYFQETGRAGRDGLPSRCLLLYTPQSLALGRFYAASAAANGNHQMEQTINQMFNSIKEYCMGTECRRAQLLAYFGEKLGRANCGACDNCCQPRETMDFTEDARWLLMAVRETGERFGEGTVIDVVRGSTAKALTSKLWSFRKNSLSEMESYKRLAGRNVPYLKALFRMLVSSGAIVLNRESKYSVFRLGTAGRDLLDGKTKSLPPLRVTEEMRTNLHYRQLVRQRASEAPSPSSSSSSSSATAGTGADAAAEGASSVPELIDKDLAQQLLVASDFFDETLYPGDDTYLGPDQDTGPGVGAKRPLEQPANGSGGVDEFGRETRLTALELELSDLLLKERETAASLNNTTRHNVISEACVLSLARMRPASLETFARVEGISELQRERYGSGFLHCIDGFCREHPELARDVGLHPEDEVKEDPQSPPAKRLKSAAGVSVSVRGTPAASKASSSSGGSQSPSPEHLGTRLEGLDGPASLLNRLRGRQDSSPDSPLPVPFALDDPGCPPDARVTGRTKMGLPPQIPRTQAELDAIVSNRPLAWLELQAANGGQHRDQHGRPLPLTVPSLPPGGGPGQRQLFPVVGNALDRARAKAMNLSAIAVAENKLRILDSYQRNGLTIPQISAHHKLRTSTVAEWLAECYAHGHALDWERLGIPEAHEKEILAELRERIGEADGRVLLETFRPRIGLAKSLKGRLTEGIDLLSIILCQGKFLRDLVEAERQKKQQQAAAAANPIDLSGDADGAAQKQIAQPAAAATGRGSSGSASPPPLETAPALGRPGSGAGAMDLGDDLLDDLLHDDFAAVAAPADAASNGRTVRRPSGNLASSGANQAFSRSAAVAKPLPRRSVWASNLLPKPQAAVMASSTGSKPNPPQAQPQPQPPLQNPEVVDLCDDSPGPATAKAAAEVEVSSGAAEVAMGAEDAGAAADESPGVAAPPLEPDHRPFGTIVVGFLKGNEATIPQIEAHLRQICKVSGRPLPSSILGIISELQENGLVYQPGAETYTSWA